MMGTPKSSEGILAPVTVPRTKDGGGVIRRPQKAKPLDDARLEQEVAWRRWFPSNLNLSPDGNTPDEIDRLVEAFERFCYEAITIKVPGGRKPFELRPAQLDTVRRWMSHRYTITLKARQVGFSTLAAAFCLWLAMGGPDRQIYMLSKTERDSISLLNKAKYAYRSMPPWVKQRGPGHLDRNSLKMVFDNESFIISSPAANDPIRGETAFLVIVDEWASFPNEEEAWASIEPATDIGGRVVGLSTAKGEGRFFHRMWVAAESGNNQFHPIFHPWWVVPGRDEAWYENKRRNMESWQLAQEYPSTPEEAFIGSGNPFFDLDRIRQFQETPGAKHTIVPAPGQFWRLIEGGDLEIWKMPVEGRAYVIGADIAQGLDHGDWTVAYVMDATTGDVVAMYRGKPSPHSFGAEILPCLGRMYNLAMIAPEVNNHGLTTVTALKAAGYQRIYRRRTQLKRMESPTETIGWLTTHGNKYKMIDGVAEWLREHEVYDRATITELKTFVREQRGESIRLHGSPHDDCVMALAITIGCLKYAVQSGHKAGRAHEVPGSISWYERQMDKARNATRRRVSPVF